MGGRLSVKSEPGRGSTFTLHLKFAWEAAETNNPNTIPQRTEAFHE